MYIRYNSVNYPCGCRPGKMAMAYSKLPDDFPAPVSGEVALCADDGFVLRIDKAEDYLRQTFADGVLVLTNIPYVEPVPESDPVPTTTELMDVLLGVTDDE